MTLKLFTLEDHFLVELNEPMMEIMTANGKPPDIVMWGERFFVYRSDMEYKEVFCVVVGLNDQLKSQ